MFKQLMSHFKTQIPVGKPQFTAWLDSVVNLVGPIADDESLRWAICNEVLHLPSGTDRVAKNYFVKRLRKFAANQIAASITKDIHDAQKARIAAELQQAEATAATEGTTADEQKAQ